MERQRIGFALASGLALAAALAACGDAGRGQAPARIAGGAASLESLAEQVWSAIVARDTAALQRWLLTEREHNHVVWPELPASAAAAGFPVDFAWQNIRTRNAAALADLLDRFAGSGQKLVDARCEGEPESHQSFRILRDCWLVLQRHDGTEERVQAFRHVLEMGGRYKLFRYYGNE